MHKLYLLYSVDANALWREFYTVHEQDKTKQSTSEKVYAEEYFEEKATDRSISGHRTNNTSIEKIIIFY